MGACTSSASGTGDDSFTAVAAAPPPKGLSRKAVAALRCGGDLAVPADVTPADVYRSVFRHELPPEPVPELEASRLQRQEDDEAIERRYCQAAAEAALLRAAEKEALAHAAEQRVATLEDELAVERGTRAEAVGRCEPRVAQLEAIIAQHAPELDARHAALLGEPAMTFRLFGAAVRESNAILAAAPVPLRESANACFATDSFRRLERNYRVPRAASGGTENAEMSSAVPVAKATPPASVEQDDGGSRAAFGEPSMWRVRGIGVASISVVDIGLL